MMRMGMSMRMEQVQIQRSRLAQRLEHRLRLMQRLELGDWEPLAICPECQHELDHEEIVKGFSSHPIDIRTTCPKCGHRFKAKLTLAAEKGMGLPYYCPKQCLEALKEMADLTRREIATRVPAVYYSTQIHFGNLKKAFAAMGVKYLHHQPWQDWQEKVDEYLGDFSDGDIALYAGVSRSTIRRRRLKLGIDACYR